MWLIASYGVGLSMNRVVERVLLSRSITIDSGGLLYSMGVAWHLRNGKLVHLLSARLAKSSLRKRLSILIILSRSRTDNCATS